MSKRIGFTYNLRAETKHFRWLPNDFNAEFDTEELINTVAEAIEAAGHTVIRLGNAYQLLEKINELSDVDIVFNIAEGAFGRNRESQVPIILEMLDIPYVGSDGLTMGITLDKLITKKILTQQGVNTPKFFEIRDADNLNGVPLKYPMIVKPCCEGSSKGITRDSVVYDKEALYRQADIIIKKYQQPALVEEFIEGLEFTVAVLGNTPAEVLPPVQIEIDSSVELGDRFYTFDYLRSDSLKYVCPAKIPTGLSEKLKEMALCTYQAVECRDFGRIDFRVDKEGIPYVLEINPLPSLSEHDVFPQLAKYLGISWQQIIIKILNYALQRYELEDKEKLKRKVLS